VHENWWDFSPFLQLRSGSGIQDGPKTHIPSPSSLYSHHNPSDFNSFTEFVDNTKSNRTRVIKTPGGKLRYLHIKKPGKGPRCGDCGITLPGVASSSLFQILVPVALFVSVLMPGSLVQRLTCFVDSRPPSSRILPSPQEPKESPTCVWRISLCKLCQGSSCSGIPY
jgi:Ribosomal protein L34e